MTIQEIRPYPAFSDTGSHPVKSAKTDSALNYNIPLSTRHIYVSG